MVIQQGSQMRTFNASPPVFEQLPSSIQFTEGGDATFQCRIIGNPAPEVVWTRRGMMIRNDNKRQISYDPQSGLCRLTLKNVSVEDDGEYTCTAINSAGESSLTVNINRQLQRPQMRRVESQEKVVSKHWASSVDQQMTSGFTGQESFHRTSSTKYSTEIIDAGLPHEFYTGRDENFRIDTFEYRILREVEYRESLIRQHETTFQSILEQEKPALPNQPLVAPIVRQKPRNSKAKEGSEVTFQVHITSNPPPKLFWFKNGQKLITSDRVTTSFINNIAVLQIKNVQPSDEGYYTLLAQNNLGNVACSAHLVIDAVYKPPEYSTQLSRPTESEYASETNGETPNRALKPVFHKIPTNQEVAEGKMVRFDCRVGGRPLPDVTWYINGRQLLDDPNHKLLVNEGGVHSLLITSTSRHDAGTVTCVAKNRNGDSRFDVNLVVIEKEQVVAPKFVERFKTMHLKEGESVTLHCRAVGTPVPRMTWQKDGNQVHSKPPHVIVETNEGSTTLYLNNVRELEAGWYQCTAQNQAGSTATRARVFVEVDRRQEYQPLPLHLPKPQKVIEPQPEAPRETIFLRHIERAAPHMPHPEDESPQFTEKPTFLSEIRSVQVVEGGRITFETRLMPIGDPNMIVEWYLNGRLVQASSRVITTYRFGYVALQILYTYQSDSGTYTCRAINGNGEAVTSASLQVLTKSSVDIESQHPESMEAIRHLEDYDHYRRQESIDESVSMTKPVFINVIRNLDDLMEGQKAHFEAFVTPTSDPTMRIEWYFNNQPLTEGSRIATVFSFGHVALDISYLRAEDSGVYTCRAVNAKGEAMCRATLMVKSTSLVTTDLGIPEQRQYIEKTQQLEEQHRRQMQHGRDEMDTEPMHPPKFKRQLKDLSGLEENAIAHFEAILLPEHDSSMQVTWLKDGKPVECANRITTFFNFGYVSLTINRVETRDNGVYTVVATNRLGTAQSSARLNCTRRQSIILDPQFEESWQRIQMLEDTSRYRRDEAEEIEINQRPKFLSPLHGPEKLNEGEKAHFETRLEPSADSSMTVEWYHNGKLLTAGHRFKTFFDFGYVALDILYMYPEDSGVYTLKAKNRLGEAILQKEVVVTSKRAIDTTTINTKGMQRIQQLENRQHVVYEDQDEEFDKPVFVTQLRGTSELTTGQAAHFECRIKPISDPQLTVQWYLNGVELKTGSRFNFIHDFGFVALDIASVVPSDSGIYSVQARNAKGEAVASARLIVHDVSTIVTDLGIPEQQQYIAKTQELEEYHRRATQQSHLDMETVTTEAPSFKHPISDQINVPEGKLAHFESVLLPQGDSTMRVEWYKDGQPLTASSRITTFFDFGYVSLTIKGVDTRDSGTYTCVATNSIGTTQTSARLTCISKSSVVLDSQYEEGWEKIQSLEGAPKYHREEFIDEEVNQKPVFVSPLTGPDHLIEGQRAHFETRLEPVNDSSMTVEWYCNGRALTTGHRFRTYFDFGYVALDILYVYPEDSGVFTLKARNRLGEAVATKQLTVQAKSRIDTSTLHNESIQRIEQLEGSKHRYGPEEIEERFDKPVFLTPLKGKQDLVEGQSAHFECRVSPVGDASLRILWYLNGIEMKSGSRFNFTHDFGYVCLDIASVIPGDSGTYTCRAINDKGEAITTITLRVNAVGTIITDLGIPEQKQYIEKTQELEEYQKRHMQHQFLELDTIPKEVPRFTKELSDQINLSEGQTAHFEASLSPQGDPTMRVEWFKDGIQVAASSRITTFFNFGYVALTIKGVDTRDNGTYTCVALNSMGKAQTSAKLTSIGKGGVITDTQFEEGWEKIQHLEEASKFQRPEFQDDLVNEPPKFTAQLSGAEEYMEGQSAHFETRLEPKNDPNMVVEWFLNGKPLPTGHRYKTYYDFGYVALDILYIYPEDSGTFTVVARNRLGQDTLSKEIRVKAKSRVDTSTLHNESVQKIQQLEGSKFVRQTEEPETDFEKPIFITPLQGPSKLVEGQFAHFECRVTPVGDVNLKIYWYLNGIEVKQGSRFNFIHDFGYVSMDIASVIAEDSGVYTCKAVNLKGEAVTTATLEVKSLTNIITDLGIPEQKKYIERAEELEEAERRKAQHQFLDLEPVISQQPQFTKPISDQLNIHEGRIAHFEATLVPQGDSKMKVEWFHNGKAIDASSRITTFYNFGYVSLTIKEVDTRDVGVYTCVATNANGTAKTSAKLTCITKESIVLESQFEEGWEKIQHLEEAAKFQRPEHLDAEVKEKPRFTAPLTGPDTLVEGQSTHFETRLEPRNDPNMTVQWFFNGKPLATGHRFRTYHDFGYVALDILYVYPEDSGTYTVVAKNRFGEDTTQKTLTIHARSRIDTSTLHDESIGKIQQLENMKNLRGPEEPEKSFEKPQFITPITGPEDVREGQFIHYECRVIPVDDPKLQVIWYKNDVELKTGSRFNFTHDFGYVCLDIASAVLSDAGVYKCRAVNEKGEDSVTIVLKVRGEATIITDLGFPEQKQYIQKAQELEDYKRRLAQAQYIDVDLIPKQAPVFKTQLVDQINVPEGRTVHFEATLEPQGDQTMKVEWFKDEKIIEASSRITTFFNFGYVSLTIKEVDERDIGTYCCVATNRIGTAKTVCRMTIITRKTIILDSQYTQGAEQIQLLEHTTQRTEQEEFEVKEKPQFLRPLSTPEKVVEGQSAHFETRLRPTNDPELIVEWYFNGKPLRTGHRFRTFHDFGYVALDILYVYPEDSGEYVCRAVNELGEDIVKATLVCKAKPSLIYHTQLPKEMESGVMKIAELEASLHRFEEPEEAPLERSPPMFVMKPEPLVVNEGEPAKFCCRVIGHPRPRIMWVLNGKQVVSGSRYRLTYDGIYHFDIPKARQYDQGTIEVYARNLRGQVHCSTTLDVRPRHDDYRVVLKHSPKPWYDETVRRYQQDRQECELEKIFEEKLVPGGSEVQVWRTEEVDDYERKKVKEHLTQTEQLGTVKRYKTETMYVDKREAERRPEDQSQVQFMAKSYQSKVESEPLEAVAHGKEVTVQVQRQQQTEQKGDLQITRNIKTTETRTKEHRAMTKEQKVAGPPQETAPPAFKKKIQPCRVYEGERAVFECEFSGVPIPTIVWYRENFAIQNSRDFQIETSDTGSRLTIREVFMEDSGVFSVKAENRAGSAKSSANLIVEEAKDLKSGSIPPSFAQTIQDTTSKTGQLVRLDARVTGSKPLEVYWLKDSVKVTPDITHKVFEEDDQKTLLILEATPQDTGNYECVAINQVGEARCQAKVTIEGTTSVPTTPTTDKPTKKPKLIEPLKDTVVQEGQSVLLKCKIAGVTANQITWYKGDSPIKQSRYFRMGNDRDNVTLRISEAFPEDEGVYKCTASTTAGTVTTSATLRVILPEAVEKAPQLSSLADLKVPEGTPARFVTSLAGLPPPTISWYKDKKLIKPSTNIQMLQDNASCSLVIYKAMQADAGVYTCQATNNSGTAESSAKLTVESKQ